MSENATKESPKPKDKEDDFCANRTRTETCLASALIGVIIYFIYYKYSLSQIEYVQCEEPEYIEAVLEINDFIDPSIDPCEDFNQFVCGNFYKTAYSKQISTPMLDEYEHVQYDLNSFIVEPISDDDSKHVKLQKKFFQTCLDLQAIEIDEDQTFSVLIEEIGGWPVLKGQTWDEESFDWMEVMIKCKQLGLPFQWFLQFNLHVEEEDNILEISYPTITYNSNKNYIKLLEDIVVAMSGSRSTAKNAMVQLALFEKELFNISKNNTAEISVGTVEQLDNLNLKYNWLEFLNNLTEENHEFTKNTKVAFNIDTYILALDHLLIKTPKRVQANYIAWKITEYFVPYLSHGVRSIYEDFKEMTEMSRIKKCISNTAENFPYVSEAEYIRKYAKPEIRKSAKNITNFIRAELVDRLKKVFWIKNETLNDHINKFETAEIDVGGQDEIFDKTSFDDNHLHVGNLEFDSHNPNIVEMVTERWKSYYESMFGAIGQRGIKTKKSLYLNNVEMVPHFIETENRIVIPTSILHGLIYNHKRPEYLNYGSLGVIIGQELTRSFLDQLRIEDTIRDIWTHKDYKVFENGTKCFEDDFSRLHTFNITADIIQEVISDIIGRDLSYVAYQKWLETNQEKIKLLPLPYSPNQLFWIKSSLIYCYKSFIDDEDEIAPIFFKYKNVLSVRHSPHFAKDFECPQGSPMNPKSPKKCWLFL